MKHFAAILAIFGATLSAKPAEPQPQRRQLSPADPLDVDRMLWAIEQAENTPYWKVGRDGERSVYQITPVVWATWSTFPHRDASSNRVVCRAEARRVALRQVEHIRVALARFDVPDRPVYVALAYSAGVAATINKTASAAKWGYANRVNALYFSSHE